MARRPATIPDDYREVVAESGLQLSDIAADYGDNAVLAEVNLDLAKGQVTALCGPSGCGKSTLLRVLAGLHRPSAGTVTLDGRTLTGPSTWVEPERRGIGLVFQDGALFAHLNVAQNIGFGLPRGERRAGPRIDELLELAGLTVLRHRFPHELSGGQRQRVAIARALAPRPAALLLDEPFANLDAVSRRSLRQEMVALLRSMATTVVFVTHDREEAWSVASSIAVMNRGRIEQHDSPEQTYVAPRTEFVARFLGDLVAVPALAGGDLDGTTRFIRPEHIGLHPAGPTGAPVTGAAVTGAPVTGATVTGATVTGVAFDGPTTTVTALVTGTPRVTATERPAPGPSSVVPETVIVRLLSPSPVQVGDPVDLRFPSAHQLTFST